MAYYSIFPEKDSTLYSHPDRLEMNTGNDEILELVKEKGSNNDHYYPSRILVKFKDEEIKNAFTKAPSNVKVSASLQLFSTEHQNLASNIEIEAYPVSESWDEGTGKFSNLPTSSNGCTWLYRDNSIRTTKWKNTGFFSYSSGSIESDIIPAGGGTWYTENPINSNDKLKSSQSFSNADILDLNLDVSTAVTLMNRDALENQGFIVKYKDSIETYTSSSKGYLQFFSADTHTIYPPKLTFKWDDSVYIDEATENAKFTGELSVSLYRNKKEYNQNDEALIRLHVRDKYPNRSFTTSSNYLEPGYFTKNSYYSIRDAHTEEEIIPFDDNFTKLSADTEGMFFKLYMKGLQPERYYRILFKHINKEGIEIFDNNYHFKVVR